MGRWHLTAVPARATTKSSSLVPWGVTAGPGLWSAGFWGRGEGCRVQFFVVFIFFSQSWSSGGGSSTDHYIITVRFEIVFSEKGLNDLLMS